MQGGVAELEYNVSHQLGSGEPVGYIMIILITPPIIIIVHTSVQIQIND